MEFIMRPIGMIYSPFTDSSQTPIQSCRSQAIGQVSVFPEYAEGLADLEGFSHIFLLYAFHQSIGYELLVKPFLDDMVHGLFATRFPSRPNPIGLSVVRILSIHDHIVEIRDVDVLDGTPLLDIKPYVEEFDVRTETRSGWYKTRSKR
jgi:tRNA-Thr(GGU) m(6)t(6)A37 methyltransferase TsaA